ncbi:transcription factor FER-LIKE IRON DEFICIENCY-INDUCED TRANSCRIPTION FACTOR-like protein [Cinnamomum micranthum f. kanehirae]|uniref:Transcription factor FER-LIKE IRON DEFICIENCY-INDUCED TRANSCRIPTION FACTOR-like protein n=1 Tax=Cinnamomum micranthum f. kanehirae TaxID=337451 RepID=A0A3S3MGS9_9MAGN|nr:transcription factor FER-LIKE IRON DEFICIENCY-INDUCED TRANSCRIPTION FACTOR-like protein [Cinnamomum micranthum f. kanehirae]
MPAGLGSSTSTAFAGQKRHSRKKEIRTEPYTHEFHDPDPRHHVLLAQPDDIHIPTFLDEFPDFTLQNDQLFNFPTSNDQNNPLPLHPLPNYTNESLLFDDFETDIDMLNTMQPQVCMSAGSVTETALTPIEGNESNQCINCDAWLVEPPEESYEEPIFGSAVSADTAEMFVNSAAKRSMLSRSEEMGDNEEDTDEERRTITSSCKNLVSERNRRKRLSQQLLALRALVPNITKMDKRSVLVDALAYLSSIHEEIERIKKEELKHIHNSYVQAPTNTTLQPQRMIESQTQKPKPRPKSQILEIDAEKMEDRRFVVKITCKGSSDAGGEVLRIIESLGVEITYTALDKIKPMLVLVTIFIRMRKQGKMTEEKLKDCITSTALKSGLLLKNP